LKSVHANEEQQRQMLKISEVSKRSGIGIEALRFYEKSCLLDKLERTDSGWGALFLIFAVIGLWEGA
jgi:hypothetical protein